MKVGKHNYTVRTPKSEAEKFVGYSQHTSIEPTEGLLLEGVNHITMKETSFPLKLAFIKNDEVIIVKYGIPYADKPYIVEEADSVLELHAEADVVPGDKIEETKYLFSYGENKIEGTPYELEGYTRTLKGIIEGDDSVKGNLVEATEELEDLMETEVEDGIYTYNVQTKKSNIYLLDEVGEVQHELAGRERIFSIKDSLKLIKLVNKANSDNDYKKLGLAILNMIDIQDTNPDEYVQLKTKN